jgi:uncharacterized coiled-coil DUF342 family protein
MPIHRKEPASASDHHDIVQRLEHIHQHLLDENYGLRAIVDRLAHLERREKRIMSVLDDIKTINAETKAKVVNLDTKLDAALAKNAGYREAIKTLKARIEELIAAGPTDGIDAAGAAELVTLAQEIEDSTDAATVKADILANTDEDA